MTGSGAAQAPSKAAKRYSPRRNFTPLPFATPAMSTRQYVLTFSCPDKPGIKSDDPKQNGCPAKAAIINFSRAVSSEGAAGNIRCNVVIPGVVATPATADMLSNEASRKNTEKLIPMRRIGEPVELANAVLFLASDEASYITGATLSVDGGRAADLITAIE